MRSLSVASISNGTQLGVAAALHLFLLVFFATYLHAATPLEEIRNSMRYDGPYVAECTVDYTQDSTSGTYRVAVTRYNDIVGVRSVHSIGSVAEPPFYTMTANGEQLSFATAKDFGEFSGMYVPPDSVPRPNDANGRRRWKFGIVDPIFLGVFSWTEMTSSDGVLGGDCKVELKEGLYKVESASVQGRFTGWFDPRQHWMPTRLELVKSRGNLMSGQLINRDIGGDLHYIVELDLNSVNESAGTYYPTSWKFRVEKNSVVVRQEAGKVDRYESLRQPDDFTPLFDLNIPSDVRITEVGAPQISYEWDGKWVKPSSKKLSATVQRVSPIQWNSVVAICVFGAALSGGAIWVIRQAARRFAKS